MENRLEADITGEQEQTNFASSKREEVMRKLKDLKLQEQKYSEKESRRGVEKHNTEAIRFDFQGVAKPVKTQTGKKFERRSLSNIELMSAEADKGCKFERRSLSNIESMSAEAEMGYKYEGLKPSREESFREKSLRNEPAREIIRRKESPWEQPFGKEQPREENPFEELHTKKNGCVEPHIKNCFEDPQIKRQFEDPHIKEEGYWLDEPLSEIDGDDLEIINMEEVSLQDLKGIDIGSSESHDMLDNSGFIEKINKLNTVEELSDSHTPDHIEEYVKPAEPERSYQNAKPDDKIIKWENPKKSSIGDVDSILQSMLKKTNNLSPYMFLINETEEELAVIIEGEIYMNEAATINLLEKSEAADTDGRKQEAAKLWEIICYYSVDAGCLNIAFWNLVNHVYMYDMDKIKVILEAMLKKEKRLYKLMQEISN